MENEKTIDETAKHDHCDSRVNVAPNCASYDMTIDEAIAHAKEVSAMSNTPCARQHRQLANWLRELRDLKNTTIGNAAAIREALIALVDYYQITCHSCMGIAPELHRLVYNARAALALPRRNCDVGTEKEKKERFRAVCKAFRQHDDSDYCSYACPIDGNGDCYEKWAQMPYEEGGAK